MKEWKTSQDMSTTKSKPDRREREGKGKGGGGQEQEEDARHRTLFHFFFCDKSNNMSVTFIIYTLDK